MLTCFLVFVLFHKMVSAHSHRGGIPCVYEYGKITVLCTPGTTFYVNRVPKTDTSHRRQELF